ncbi:hypothetical protein [Pelagibacterium xiamenense]|uniref:hypothetical protein n=1 Tax=Pelagibacterium xiamenense TaxID=2901140 RepID=UPI001E34ECB8|nr:hypothetical protein [Pelagibacterium xiamenense]MCD7061041.1 hypothetical protein [Pelagibacterium xiamenense]
MSSFKALVAVIAGLATTAPAVAQNVHISRLYEQVLENIEIAGDGYLLDSYGINRMNAGETAHVTLDLPTGVPVTIMGDCDEDCLDLDIAVYSAERKLLAEDRADDYYPIVNFNSDEIVRVDIELDLEICEANYCYVAYSVFIQEN